MNCPINIKNCTPWKVIKNSVHQYESYHVNQELRIEIHNSVNTIARKWKQHEHQFSKFLHVDFFKAIEAAKFKNLDFRYIIVYENDELSGLIPIQLTTFRGKNSIRQNFRNTFKNWLKNWLSFNAMIAGNILVSGPYMNAFINKNSLEAQMLTEDVMDFYSQILKEQEKKNYRFHFIKDVLTLVHNEFEHHINENFVCFNVEPVMRLDLPPIWEKFDDYLASMTSKYRVRYRRANKKLGDITSRELQLNEIIEKQEKIYSLYKNVLQNIDFTLFVLPKNYFSSLKKHLHSSFRLIGYFDQNDELVGFYTLINNKKQLHAHFLGYDKDVNNDNQLYLNMLYSMVEKGIESNFSSIDMGRTAMGIKSSIGAVPVQMTCYIKHQKNIINQFIPSIIQQLNPQEEWIQRHPFKDELVSV